MTHAVETIISAILVMASFLFSFITLLMNISIYWILVSYILDLIEVFWGTSGCFEVWKCCRIFQISSEYFLLFRNISKYSTEFQNISIFRNISQNFEVFRIFQVFLFFLFFLLFFYLSHIWHMSFMFFGLIILMKEKNSLNVICGQCCIMNLPTFCARPQSGRHLGGWTSNMELDLNKSSGLRWF